MPNKEIILTKADKLILQAMRTVVQGLGLYLGEGCEVILHSLENLESSAIEVIHGHHSGRKTGAAITNLALEMLEDMERSGEKKTLAYFNHNRDGITIKSATIPIIGEYERIIGLLCLNFYTDITLYNFINTFFPVTHPNQDTPHMIESFTQDVDEMIAEAVTQTLEEVIGNPEITAINKNKEIIIRLEEKGIFNIKDAVVKVAKQLEISKNTVYMHLRNLKK